VSEADRAGCRPGGRTCRTPALVTSLRPPRDSAAAAPSIVVARRLLCPACGAAGTGRGSRRDPGTSDLGATSVSHQTHSPACGSAVRPHHGPPETSGSADRVEPEARVWVPAVGLAGVADHLGAARLRAFWRWRAFGTAVRDDRELGPP
jgi:hypothetical protein